MANALALVLGTGGANFALQQLNLLCELTDLVVLLGDDLGLILDQLLDLLQGRLDGRATDRSRGTGGCSGGSGSPDGSGSSSDRSRRRSGCRSRLGGQLRLGRADGDGVTLSGATDVFEARGGVGVVFLLLLVVVLVLVGHVRDGALLVLDAGRGSAGNSGLGLLALRLSLGCRGARLGRGLVVGGNLLGGGPVVDALEVELGRNSRLAVEPLLGAAARLGAGGRREDVGLEGLGTAGDGERDGLDVGIVDGLVGAHNFVVVDL